MTILTRKANIFLAKKTLVENIYNSAYLEGCNITFPQTQTLLEGSKVSGIVVDDIQIVLNLRDAWKYVLNTLDEPLTVEYICNVNSKISYNESLDWGVLRYGHVGVSGTNWIPKVPNKEEVIQNVQNILDIKDPIERVTEYCCYAIKNQLFWDGNKRTSLMIANKILIENGYGVLSISPENGEEYNTALSHYYNTDDKMPFKNILVKCIKTIEFTHTLHDFCDVTKEEVNKQSNER